MGQFDMSQVLTVVESHIKEEIKMQNNNSHEKTYKSNVMYAVILLW